ncbi:MAG: GNAT family N-acetyltransferase [Burkholderiaceae bacterium]
MSGASGVRLADYDPHWLDFLVPMWRASFELGVGIKDPHPLEEQRQHFVSNVVPSSSVRVALLGEDLVGFVAANRESIAQLYVRVGYHGRGIGSELLAWAKRQSAGSLWLFTFARNSNARRFYEARNFKVVQFGFEPTWQLGDVKYAWSAPRNTP